MVTSKTYGKKIMVERSMYWNNRGAGTDTIGGTRTRGNDTTQVRGAVSMAAPLLIC